MDGANRVGQPAQVEVKEIALGEAPKTLSVAPVSVNIYRFQWPNRRTEDPFPRSLLDPFGPGIRRKLS